MVLLHPGFKHLAPPVIPDTKIPDIYKKTNDNIYALFCIKGHFICVPYISFYIALCATVPSVHFTDPVADSIPRHELREKKKRNGRREKVTEKKTLR